LDAPGDRRLPKIVFLRCARFRRWALPASESRKPTNPLKPEVAGSKIFNLNLPRFQ
jgi:hypothetical protein